MTYKIIHPPFEKDLEAMSAAELKEYFQWFLDVIPERVDVLEEAVRTTPGFESWRADYSPSSLGPLGRWFTTQVETRSLSAAEREQVREKNGSLVVPDEKLTHKTYSLAVDVGMYLGQVFVTNHPSLKWGQDISNKRFAFYGQPLIIGFGSVPFNPAGTVLVLAHGIVSKTKTGDRLTEVYKIWEKRIGPSS